jgi:hypothetical protein
MIDQSIEYNLSLFSTHGSVAMEEHDWWDSIIKQTHVE